MLVDHMKTNAGRICPAASLYSYGHLFSERMKWLSVSAGDVVACRPNNWIEWVGMMLGCLRRGACFAPLSPHLSHDWEKWVTQTAPTVILEGRDIARRITSGFRRPPLGWLLGRPPLTFSEEDIDRRAGQFVLSLKNDKQPIWLVGGGASVDDALRLWSLLRTNGEIHIGVDITKALELAGDADWIWSSQQGLVRAGGWSSSTKTRGDE